MSNETTNDLQARISALSPERRALFEKLLSERGGVSVPDVPPRDTPLSRGQWRLWFMDQVQPDSPAYNESTLFFLDGSLDVGALEAALRHVVERHDILRSAVVSGSEGPRLRAVSTAAFTLAVTECAVSELRERARQDAATPFDLGRAPLLRATLFRTPEGQQALCVTAHHIVCDGWSLGIVTEEVLTCYAAYREHRTPRLPALTLQYADHARREDANLRAGRSDESLKYFAERLGDAPAPLELPADRPRPSQHRGRGARAPLTVPPDVVQGVKALARRRNATLFMATLAVFDALLARYTGATDVVVGTMAANRLTADLEPLVGFFVNPLPLRTDLSGNPTVEQLVDRVRDSCLGAFSHQDAPFEQVVERLGQQRELVRHAPVFQITFNVENAPAPAAVHLADLTVRPEDNYANTSKMDLTVALREVDGGLTGFLEYDTDLFDRDRVERLATHFETALAVAAHDPSLPLSALRFMTRGELADSARLGGEPCPVRAAEPLLARFAAQLDARADQPAVVCGPDRLTYGELAERSDRVARRLRAAGVEPGSRVAVCLPRSADLVVALLAVMKAGAAFVPVDMGQPAERISMILEDCGAAAVLTDREDRAPWGTSARILLLDTDTAIYGAGPATPPAADEVAYVIYTSGTTGRPKGVMVTHRGLANYLTWAVDAYGAEPGRESVLHTSVAVDLTITSIFVPLASGGVVRVLPEGAGVDALASWVAESSDVGVLKVTPAHVRMLSDVLEPDVLRRLRGTMVVGGEALHAEHIRAFRDGASGLGIVNEYGPTETVVGCVVHTVGAFDPRTGSVPIGRPIRNTGLHVLDDWLQPVPVGVPGELYVDGAGVARGYLADPGLTATRFVAGPNGTRWYRTGDLVRRRTDGVLEYLGRKDTQVKLHGFRVELGEIDHVLLTFPGVGDAAATVRPGAGDEPVLVAYVVPDAAADLVPERLLEFLASRLPAHMVPAAVRKLAELPLSGAGKLDRDALPPLDVPARCDFIAPVGPTETALAGVWMAVLNCGPVGREDDFFDLGGQSVLATQVVARVRTVFGVDLPLLAVFEARTLTALAERIDAAPGPDQDGTEPPVATVARDGYLPLSHVQNGFWYLQQLDRDSTAYNVPAALRLRGQLDLAALRSSLNAVVARHESLRTSFRLAPDEEPVQVIAPALDIDVPCVDLSGHLDAEGEIARRVAVEAGTPFDLARLPLLRAQLLRVAEDDHVLLFTVHHIVCDAWSTTVLARQIGSAYAAYVAGQPCALPPMPIQYADYAAWERRRLRDDVVERELAYWRAQLAGSSLHLDLPHDTTGTTGAESLPFRVPAGLWRALVSVGATADATPFMVLLATWQALLGAWSGQEDVVVGSPVANRGRAEFEGLIGPFFNTLPLRTNLGGRPSFTELLKRVRGTVLDALAHREVPFEKVVEALAPQRSPDRTPIFQVLLAYENTPLLQVDLSGLSVEPVVVQTGTAKFDLTFTVAERGDELIGTLEYDRGRFLKSTAELMLVQLDWLLRAVVAEPDLPVGDLLLTEDEDRSPRTEYPVAGNGELVYLAFERDADRIPDLPALEDGDGSLSYAAANARANQLAHHLRALGVGPEVPVVVALEQPVDAAVANLAVLKAGGCFVSAGQSVAVAEAVRAASAGIVIGEAVESAGVTFVDLRRDRAAIERRPPTNPEPSAHTGTLACLVAVAGSDGEWALVGLEHGELVSQLTTGSPLLTALGSVEEPGLFDRLPDERLHVLDGKMRQTPTNVVGEVYVGGVARGFPGRPDLAAQCFVADPYSGKGGERLFRTGHRGRRRADGTVELLDAVAHDKVATESELVADTEAPPYVAPRTETEMRLVEIWSDVLALEEVGIHDDFFDLGGHSLLAIQMISRVTAATGVELPVRAVLEAATVAAFAERLEQAAAEPDQDRLPEVECVDRGVPQPLSFTQEGLWFVERFGLASHAYNIAGGVRLRGHVEVVAVERAIQQLVARHEPLRTRFPPVDGKPVQVIEPDLRMNLERVDLSQESAGQETAARELMERRSRERFDLATAPLLRATLIRLDADDVILFLVVHHIVADGWALGVLIREFSELYAAEVAGVPAGLPDLPVQHVDVAVWQRDWLAGEKLEQQLSYWRTNLSAVPEALELPTDFVRPAVMSVSGASVPFELPSEDWRALVDIGTRAGATPFMVMLAVWQVLLARWSGQNDVVVGTPVAGRDRPEFEDLMGPFINTLPLRVDVSDDPTFSETLDRVRETVLNAFAHRHVPFEKIVEAVAPARDASRRPLVQVMFQLDNTPSVPLSLQDLVLEPIELEADTSKVDLSLSVSEFGGGLTGYFYYSVGLFTAETIERVGARLRALVRSVTADPDTPISRYSLTDTDERRKLVTGWSGRSRGTTLLDLFAAQVGRVPDQLAVVLDGEQLTYAELDRRTDALAAALRASGAGPETRVGILLGRSLRLVEAAVATLKAGGIVVPLDPQLPAERLAVMVEDAAPVALVTEHALAHLLPDTTVPVVVPDAVPAASDDAPAVAVDVHPENGAYLVYTSGTTGRPKPVLVSHRALVHHLATRQELYPVLPTDRCLQKAALGFDVGIWELLGPLTLGATVVMASGVQDSAGLVRLIAEQRVTVAHFGPAMLGVVLDDRSLSRCRDLRLLFTGGEPLTHDLRERFLAAFPDAQLVHQYGPTETTVDVTYFTCPAGPTTRALPIGRPARGTTVYVLDGSLAPVSIGIPGELYVGGATLARGYLGRSDLTAERFVADPFGEPGGRLYRTGDRVRWLESGDLEFIGRTDRQIKLRGYRIELAEVETALRTYPAVRDAVAVVHDPGTERMRIAGFVTIADGAGELAALRSFLAERLPEWMVPAELFVLDEIPLTVTGKVDHGALERRRSEPEPGPVTTDGPDDPLERAIIEIFCEILDVPQLGRADSFFENGGNSLIAIRAVERIAEVTGRELPLPEFFGVPTAGEVAALVRGAGGWTAPTAGAVPLHKAAGPKPALYCVHTMLGGVSEYTDLARLLTDTDAVYGLRAAGLDGDQPTPAFVEEIAAGHVARIARTDPDGPYRLLGWSFGGIIAYEVARLLRAEGQPVRQVVLVDTWAPQFMAKAFETDQAHPIAGFAANLFGVKGEPPIPDDSFWQLPLEEQLAALVDWATAAGALPPAATVDEIRRRYAVHDAHVRALLAYRPRPIDVPITVVRARDAAGVLHEWFPDEATTRGWDLVVPDRAALRLSEIPGGHHDVLKPPDVAHLASLCSIDYQAGDG